MQHAPIIARESITAVILAGGRGQRMGGRDKGLIPVAGRAAIEYAIDAVSDRVRTLLISANRNQARYRRYKAAVVGDTRSGYQGPLAGILSALDAAGSDYLLTLPCDAPLLHPDFVDIMATALPRGDCGACLAWDGQRLQPMFALLHRSLAHSLREFLDVGGRRVMDWFESLHPTAVDLSAHRQWFFNMNTPADRAWLEGQLVAA
ncbi:MAG: molybdenum cofactor guanylyltransferase MobA [Gammaproteobacteria bacterium]|jgi:molybdenum cofactor guanylyltransferase